MNIQTIRTRLNTSFIPDDEYAHYSIVIPLIEIDNRVHLLYEIRSPHLKKQPNEICFPGGKVEPNETYEEAAIREATEELGISQNAIEIIGTLNPIVTPFNMMLHLYVGILDYDCLSKLTLNPDEVSSTFTVPLEWFLNQEPEKYELETTYAVPPNFPYHKIQQGKSYPWKTGLHPVHFYTYGEYIIWGMTARMTYQFAQKIKNQSL